MMARQDTQAVAPGPQAPLGGGDPGVVSDTTILYGRCIRMEGHEVWFQRSNGQLVKVTLPENLIREVAQHFQEDMRLEGTAVWSLDTWDIVDFFAHRILSYERISPSQAFQALADAAGDALDGIDAAAYVQELRSDD